MGNGWCISLLSPISFSLAFPPCHASLNAITISDDSTLLVGAFADSTLRVWTLTPRQLLSMATGRQLSQIPLSAEDSTTRMMDPLLVCVCVCVCVHACVCVTAYMSEHLCKFIMNCHMSGPVCNPPSSSLLVTCSTASEVKVLRGHCGPVFSAAINYDNSLLLSASEDGTSEK